MNSLPNGFQTPILLLVFNRPETTKRVFEAIRLVKPKHLYIAADGPRDHKSGEREICNFVREIVTKVDWDCEVVTLFREKNLGCGTAVSEALKWFFGQVEYGIVLEDDCLPNTSFFAFCEKMLKLYESDEQVKIVSGTNYLFNNKELLKDDYFFSTYFSIWGWASWKRVVSNINWNHDQLKSELTLNKVEKHFNTNPVIANWMYSLIKETFDSKIDTWDSVFVCNLILQNGLSVVPYKNQVSNIGIVGTHSSSEISDNINTKTYPINVSALQKKEIAIDFKSNNVLLDNVSSYLPKQTSVLERIIQFTKRFVRFLLPGNILKRTTHFFERAVRFIARKTGHRIIQIEKDSLLLSNVFGTSHNKKALLSYVQPVFQNSSAKHSKVHTNHYTTFIIGEVLNELGYVVDVINHDTSLETDFSYYDLVVGLGKSLENALKQRKTQSVKTKVIYFGTGCNPFYSNPITMKRVSDFYSKNKVLIPESSRFIEHDDPLQHQVADCIILHGSNFAKLTYRSENLLTIHAPVFVYHNSRKNENDWKNAKQNYLWFGGGGAIHKGLDLVIDAFTELDNCNLHICGRLSNEKAFLDFYTPLFNTRNNIIYHGFTDVESGKFKDILNVCSFVIFPSCSEGNCPSVITCMANGGLIPVVTKNTDIDLNNYGVIIEDLTVDAVINAVNKSQELTIDDLKNQSDEIIKYTNEVNTFDHFRKDFKQKLQHIL